MSSEIIGKDISSVEVEKISRVGIRIKLEGHRYFLRYTEFPWFSGKDPQSVRSVEHLGNGHLRWPVLDVDLSLESIRHPERYPLVHQ